MSVRYLFNLFRKKVVTTFNKITPSKAESCVIRKEKHTEFNITRTEVPGTTLCLHSKSRKTHLICLKKFTRLEITSTQRPIFVTCQTAF